MDDEPSVRALLTATLSAEPGYQLEEACDGLKALESVNRERPDLIVLDVIMPQTDGYEVCHRIKSDPATRDISIIILTALAQEADRQRCQEVGADRYFTKPFSPEALLQKVGELLSWLAPA